MTAMRLLDSLLACPVDGSPLSRQGGDWVSESGRRYPTIQGIPVLFRPGSSNTFDAMARSRAVVSSRHETNQDPWFVNTLGLDEQLRERLLDTLRRGDSNVDAVVAHMIAATCGNLYADLVGNLPRYPIPRFRVTEGRGRVLLDLGCNWGRWCVAAAQSGFLPIGIDPQIGAVLAAQRVARELGVDAHFICADARHLPLRSDVVDVVFSYSVLQHLSREDVAGVVAESNRVMKTGARLFVQMPNVMGLRCFYQWARRGFHDGAGFNVRYWTLPQLRRAFGAVGAVNFEIDCFFGIGLQPSDSDLMPRRWRALLRASEALRKLGRWLPGISWFADSVYVSAAKKV